MAIEFPGSSDDVPVAESPPETVDEQPIASPRAHDLSEVDVTDDIKALLAYEHLDPTQREYLEQVKKPYTNRIVSRVKKWKEDCQI